jgi:hypothetical protein
LQRFWAIFLSEIVGQTAERAMATIASSSTSPAAESHARQPGLIGEIREFWHQFIVAAFHPYRPEQHYMRGPGPACAAKRSLRD